MYNCTFGTYDEYTISLHAWENDSDDDEAEWLEEEYEDFDEEEDEEDDDAFILESNEISDADFQNR